MADRRTPAIMKVIEAEIAAGAMPKGKQAAIEEVDFKPAYIASGLPVRRSRPDRESRIQDSRSIPCTAPGAAFWPGSSASTGSISSRSAGSESAVPRNQSRTDRAARNQMLQETVVREGCHAGFATDGDADRIGAVAEDGSFVDSHKIFSVLLDWLLERKQWPGEVVRAFNTTTMLDRIAAKYGRKLIECALASNTLPT